MIKDRFAGFVIEGSEESNFAAHATSIFINVLQSKIEQQLLDTLS